MIKWYYNIWLAYLKEFCDFNGEKAGFIILDRATSHLGQEFTTDLLTTGNQEASFIPGGMTRFYQPIDVSINKPFNTTLRESYINYCISNGNNNFKLSRTMMIKIICETWYNDNIISEDMIYKSFRSTGLGNKLDHSEDNLFTSWKNMQTEVPLIDDDLEKDYKYEENLDILDD